MKPKKEYKRKIMISKKLPPKMIKPNINVTLRMNDPTLGDILCITYNVEV